MSQTIIATKPFSLKTTAFWGLKIILALLFLAAAGFKISGAPMMVHEFGEVGLGQWFRYFTALTELTGAVLLLARPHRIWRGAARLRLHRGIFRAIAGDPPGCGAHDRAWHDFDGDCLDASQTDRVVPLEPQHHTYPY